MKRFLSRLLFVLLLSAGLVRAEKVADLPVPTKYVNDFAGVLSPAAQQSLEDLCTELHNQAQAEIAVVTIKTLDDGQSIEEFTSQLEDKWKFGKKGVDRSAIVLLVLNPKGLRIETGYGLEGILNDAKVGGILDQARPFATAGDYDSAVKTEVQGLADVITKDANVTLTPIVHQYHRQAAPQQLGLGQIILGIGFVLLLIYLVATGHLGWAWILLNMVSGGGGGGGGGRDDDDRGGGFGGVGGGGSGGGGASRGF